MQYKIQVLILFFFHFRDLFIDNHKCREKNDSGTGHNSSRLKSRSREYELGRVASGRCIKSNERFLVKLIFCGRAVNIKLPAVFCRNSCDDSLISIQSVNIELGITVGYNGRCYLRLVDIRKLRCEGLVIKGSESDIEIRPALDIAEERYLNGLAFCKAADPENLRIECVG